MKMSMEVANQLAVSYSEMEADPDNLQKQADYFKALADARLTDFYQVAEERDSLKARVAILDDERKATLERLKSWGNPTEPINFDNPLVMVVTAANDPKSNKFICETLHDFYRSLEVIFFDGNDTRNFEDFWDEDNGVDIRFKRMSRKELDKLMDDCDGDWEGF